MKQAKRNAAIICTILNLVLDVLAIHCWAKVDCEKMSSLYFIWAIIAIGCVTLYIIAKTAIEWWYNYKRDIRYKEND